MTAKAKTTETRPRRHTLAEAYEHQRETIGLLLARQSRPPSEGVELSRNAKGETQITVSGGCHEDETLAECAVRVAEIYTDLRARYPLASGYVGAEGNAPGRSGRVGQ